MASVEELTAAFPEVELELIGRLHERMDGPTRAEAAEVLQAAARQGKVPESDYISRTKGATEPQLHPEFQKELESEGLDPEKAVEGMKAEEEVEAENWEDQAKRIARDGDFSRLVSFYTDLNGRMNQVLQSPMREDIPEDLSIASSIVVNEIESRIDQAAMAGRSGRLVEMREQVGGIPVDDLRSALLDKILDWLKLADNDGTELAEAREWVNDPDGPAEVAERIERLRTERRYDVTAEQVGKLLAETRERYGLV